MRAVLRACLCGLASLGTRTLFLLGRQKTRRASCVCVTAQQAPRKWQWNSAYTKHGGGLVSRSPRVSKNGHNSATRHAGPSSLIVSEPLDPPNAARHPNYVDTSYTEDHAPHILHVRALARPAVVLGVIRITCTGGVADRRTEHVAPSGSVSEILT